MRLRRKTTINQILFGQNDFFQRKKQCYDYDNDNTCSLKSNEWDKSHGNVKKGYKKAHGINNRKNFWSANAIKLNCVGQTNKNARKLQKAKKIKSKSATEIPKICCY